MAALHAGFLWAGEEKDVPILEQGLSTDKEGFLQAPNVAYKKKIIQASTRNRVVSGTISPK